MVHPEAVDYLRRIQAVPYGGPTDRAWVAGVLPVYVEMLDNRVHFAQAAYRDGEFAWILGDASKRNANGEVWEPSLGQQLAHTLLRPAGQWCVFFQRDHQASASAIAWVDKHKPPVEWIADRPFGRASEMGMAAPFFQAIRDRNVCIVGPWHLFHLLSEAKSPIVRLHGFFATSAGDAWKSTDELVQSVIQKDSDLFLFAAGSASNLIIHRAWPHMKHRATLIDIGAMLDPYVGVYSRSLFLKEQWRRDVLPKNLP